MTPSPKPTENLDAINSRAFNLRSQGRAREAIAAFREGIAAFPQEAGLHNNLAVTLQENGDPDGALSAYREALRYDPTLWAAHFGAGVLLMNRSEFTQAESFLTDAVKLAPELVAAHLALYELLQIRGARDGALAHQAMALQHQQLFSTIGAQPKREVLTVMAPGDWQANIPIDFLFEPVNTTLHKLYLVGGNQFATLHLPKYDVLINAIAESDEAEHALRLCEQLIAAQTKPVINQPAAVRGTNRERLPAILHATGCNIPPTLRLSRETLEQGNVPLQVPFIVRPVGSHAGRGLEKIDALSDLPAYLAKIADSELYITSFVDYSDPDDGYFRKFRIIIVDGVPFPFHMAISKNWMVHYYNAPMAENAWMRAEEEQFLAHFENLFTLSQQRCLRDIAKALHLEYVGIDCAIDREGRILVFEADPGVIVHVSDSIELYPYKHEYVPRIFRAVERMIDVRIARSN
ncbi:MAG: tetratricopeptide repeat protein [Candidatus Eremiobacteraeota bacterium]|nr:tetratricopeptide repeat protein [Candidatus Eremiobacteraeota bacterium]